MKAQIETVRRIGNVSAIAKRLGISRIQVWRVANGKQKSERIAKQLKRYGITVAK